ncbi:hypothetical protein Sjap_013069 [Stephania japonica]|uniref:Uncharacterized protein n=1 Tax=Stephania japonica TaxID=461633 RepID=A0AAP0IZ69_9MAGN
MKLLLLNSTPILVFTHPSTGNLHLQHLHFRSNSPHLNPCLHNKPQPPTHYPPQPWSPTFTPAIAYPYYSNGYFQPVPTIFLYTKPQISSQNAYKFIGGTASRKQLATKAVLTSATGGVKKRHKPIPFKMQRIGTDIESEVQSLGLQRRRGRSKEMSMNSGINQTSQLAQFPSSIFPHHTLHCCLKIQRPVDRYLVAVHSKQDCLA